MTDNGIEGRAESKAESDMRAAMKDEAKWEARKKHALSQRLGMVRLSARRYGVIRIDFLGGSFSGCLYVGELGNFYSLIDMRLVFGPSTFEKCREYVVQNADPMPKEISPR
jgi:hypothetical protein